LAAAIRLYLDENLSPRVAEQLRRRGIDAVSARDVALLGKPDLVQLATAIEMGRVFVTSDADFLQMVAAGLEHPGIVFGIQEANTIGDWVTGLELLCLVYTPDDMKNHVEYI